MADRRYVACDLGAESGRVILGTLSEGKLTLEELHRFPNVAVRINNSLRWDVKYIYEELKTGLALAGKFDSLSCDSWGVDYVWLEGNEPPHHYRDARTDDYQKHFARVPADEIYRETGIQFMPINTLYQLLAEPSRPADRFLLMADYFNFLFSGVAKAEESLASTTQLYNPNTRAWSEKLIRSFGLPRQIFPEIVPSGTILSEKVITTCSHDTAAAVAALPAQGEGWAYLSSGTWSLLGIETKKPIITDKSREYNFTNEAGYGGSFRFLKNIAGLWVLQECRRSWGKLDYAELIKLAETAPSKALIDPNDQRFAKPGDMPDKIAAFCRETNQPVPADEGEYVRCILKSLAQSYRRTLDQIEEITGKPIKTLHIVGGGSQDALLNQLSANATGRIVVAGPVEATAAGNCLIQAIALGHLKDLDELRQIVRNSFPVQTYKPQ